METLAEFLFPCCMAAGCSPATKQIRHVNPMAYSDGCETSAGHSELSFTVLKFHLEVLRRSLMGCNTVNAVVGYRRFRGLCHLQPHAEETLVSYHRQH